MNLDDQRLGSFRVPMPDSMFSGSPWPNLPLPGGRPVSKTEDWRQVKTAWGHNSKREPEDD